MFLKTFESHVDDRLLQLQRGSDAIEAEMAFRPLGHYAVRYEYYRELIKAKISGDYRAIGRSSVH